MRKSGVKHTTLTKIESDVVIKPSVQTIAKVAKGLGVSIDDLMKYLNFGKFCSLITHIILEVAQRPVPLGYRLCHIRVPS